MVQILESEMFSKLVNFRFLYDWPNVLDMERSINRISRNKVPMIASEFGRIKDSEFDRIRLES